MRHRVASAYRGRMIRTLRAWWASERRSTLLDVLLAIALGVLGVIDLAWHSGRSGAPIPIGAVALIGLQSGALAFRRRQPMAVYAIVGFATIAYAWLGYESNVSGLAVLIAIYTVAASVPLSDAVGAAAIYVGGMTLSLIGAFQARGGTLEVFVSEFLINLLALVLAWTVGVTVRTRRAYIAALEARNTLLEREREENARLAVALERGRIARELHDVVAHNVSVVVVQAGAAERLVETDPDRARQAMRDVAATGRQALVEMRRLLGVLREDEPGDGMEPQPGVAELEALARRVRDAGLPVELSVQGQERPLPASAALSAYRIVQEALTNTLRHAGPARARVILRYLPDALEIQVSDNGTGSLASRTDPAQRTDGGGHGLIGMRERVMLFGGELTAGPRPEGGYAVVARIPTPSSDQ
jgi:signal transduction histidine kinase